MMPPTNNHKHVWHTQIVPTVLYYVLIGCFWNIFACTVHSVYILPFALLCTCHVVQLCTLAIGYVCVFDYLHKNKHY